jgi:type II secretory ATPase GspE/PulE/Tfp pilus assembly ATPase PilB-like protein
VQRDPKDLGLLEPQMTAMKEIATERQGVVLVVTPADSGRTTLMYSLIRMHDAYTSNVHTVEFEPQGAPDGVRVNKFDPQAAGTAGAPGGEFSTLVRSIMRRDPDVVAISDLPDAATAQEVSKADHPRTRTYLCFKGGDPFSAVQTYVKAVGDTRKAADSLHGVVVGKLVRKLCTNCRVNYPPTSDMLKKLGLPEGKVQQLFKKGGQVLIKNKPDTCPVCKGGGYVGTEGVFEVYPVDKDDRDLIAQGNYQGLKANWRKRALPSLQQAAIRKAVDGITSVEEIMRIATDGAPEGAPAAAKTDAAKV